MGRLGNSDALRLKLRLGDPGAAAVVSAFWSHPDLPRLFPDYLFAVHSCIRASTPLMQDALDGARLSAGTDPVANGLASYLERHIHDEDGHDTWLLEDMEALGPIKIKEVEAAQQQIIAVVRQLESEGVISLKGAVGEQYVV